MSEYPWNEKNNTFTWLSSLYNPFNTGYNWVYDKTFMPYKLDIMFSSLIWDVSLYKSLWTLRSVYIATEKLILSGRYTLKVPISPFQSSLPKTSFFSPTT